MANGDVSGLGIDWFFAVFPMGVVVMFLCVSQMRTAILWYVRVVAVPMTKSSGISQSTTVLAGRGLLRSEMQHLKSSK